MKGRILGIYPHHGKFQVVNIFGYKNRGVPGIDVVGLGHRGRYIKEKFVYLLKEHSAQSKLEHYVLCVDDIFDEALKNGNYRWIELSLFLILYSLIGLIKISNLDQCVSMGKVNVDGILEIPDGNTKIFDSFELSSNVVFIGGNLDNSNNKTTMQIPLTHMLSNMDYLSVRQVILD